CGRPPRRRGWLPDLRSEGQRPRWFQSAYPDEDNMKVRYFLIFAVLAVCASACKSEPYSVAPVSGRVTLNGKALANCEVMFQPVHTSGNYNPGPGSYGITDADGRFTLKLIGKESAGAVVGKHKVRFTMHVEAGDPSDDR